MKKNNKNISIAISKNKNNNQIKFKKLILCEWCFRPVKQKEIIKCSKCKLMLCKGCLTFIDDIPFCNNCVVEIVRNKSLLIITKGNLKNDKY